MAYWSICLLVVTVVKATYVGESNYSQRGCYLKATELLKSIAMQSITTEDPTLNSGAHP